MKGREAVKTLLHMTEWRIKRVAEIEADGGRRQDRLRREIAALRVALQFMNCPGEVIPEYPLPTAAEKVER
jgi:hypothetical protein